MHHPLVVGAKTIGARDGWSSFTDAVTAVAELTEGSETAAGIFRHDGRYFAHDLLVRHETGTRGYQVGADLLHVEALDERLVAVVDGEALRFAYRWVADESTASAAKVPAARNEKAPAGAGAFEGTPYGI